MRLPKLRNQLFNRKMNFKLLWIPVQQAESDLQKFKPERFKYFWGNNKEKDVVKDLFHSLFHRFSPVSRKSCSLFTLQLWWLTLFVFWGFFHIIFSLCPTWEWFKARFKFWVLYGNGRTSLQELNRKYWDTSVFQWVEAWAREKDYLITYHPLLYRETKLIYMIVSLLVF